jgi:hypothetical protein
VIEAWRHEHNTERPHSSPNYRTPVEFARQAAQGSRGEGSAPRSGGSGPPTPSLRPQSARKAATLSL